MFASRTVAVRVVVAPIATVAVAGAIVTVVGMPVMLEDREVVLAREVRSMGMVLIVRDRNGAPMWDVNRPVQMDPDFAESTVCELSIR